MTAFELLLRKLQGVSYRACIFPRIVDSRIDRIDEPHLINGRADLMKAFLWPIARQQTAQTSGDRLSSSCFPLR